VGQAQYKDLNLPDHDDKPFHFDIAVGVNRSHFSFTHHPQFFAYSNSDSVMSVESINSSGLSLGIPYVKHLNEHFSLRTNVFNLIFTEKAFEYRLKYPDKPVGEDSVTLKKVESISASFPLEIKFMSDRIDNFRVYMFAGGKAEYDLAANAGKKNAENLIKLKRWDLGVQAGLGFHFYFPMVVLIPELKIGWGLSNLHSRNSNLKFSNVIDKINSRTITFSLMIE
jgi:hypothetical protein